MNVQAPLRYAARVARVDSLSPSVVRLRMHAPKSYLWSAGQHVAVASQEHGGNISYYSIATPPLSSAPGEFDLVVGGGSTVFPVGTEVGHQVWLHAAEGELPLQRLRDAKKVTMICMGTGVAPMRALVLELLKDRESVPCLTLLQGARNVEDCLFFDEFTSLLPELNYLPVISGNGPSLGEASTHLRRGRVQEHLPNLDLEQVEFCVCGSSLMVEQVTDYLLEQGVKSESVFTEGY